METDLFKLGDTLVAKECLVDKNIRTFITLTEEYVVHEDVNKEHFVKCDHDERYYLSADDFEGDKPLFEVSQVLDIDEKFDILLDQVKRDAELIAKLERKVEAFNPEVVKSKNGRPTVIKFNGLRYVLDPKSI